MARVPGAWSIREASGQVALPVPLIKERVPVRVQGRSQPPSRSHGRGRGLRVLCSRCDTTRRRRDHGRAHGTHSDRLTGRRGRRGTLAPSSAPSLSAPGPAVRREPSQTLKVLGASRAAWSSRPLWSRGCSAGWPPSRALGPAHAGRALPPHPRPAASLGHLLPVSFP